ncbi:MAG: threonine aldolase family protein [Roseivirga sp.]
MRRFMTEAIVGDDAYQEDEAVVQLVNYCCALFGVEAALFVTSGMLANRLAFLAQTSPGDEVITEYNYHVHFFDSAASAAVCQVALNPHRTQDGILRASDVEAILGSKPRYNYFAQAKLVSIENTINGYAGKVYPYEEIEKMRAVTLQHNLKLHLDGARLFHAHVKTGISLAKYSQMVDSLSVCFSKGLGPPFGSMLMGSKEFIERAKRYKMWLGSGYHQVGFNAQAAYYAIKHNIGRLEEDHAHAQLLARLLHPLPEVVVAPDNVETNIVQMRLTPLEAPIEQFCEACAQRGLLLFPWLPGIARMVVNKDVSEDNIYQAVAIIKKVIQTFQHGHS